MIVAILPIVGIGIRAVAFAIGGLPNPIELAAKDSVQDLALTAAKGTGVWTVVVAGMAYATYKGWLPRRDSNKPPISRFAFWSPLAFIAILLVFWATFLARGSSWQGVCSLEVSWLPGRFEDA
jgi:hypothetical protein